MGFCTDNLVEGISKASCPQDVLRGFTGKITVKDWRGFNELNPDSNYNSSVILEAEELTIKPSFETFLRDDKVALFTHKLNFFVQNMTNDALSELSTLSNIPLIIELERREKEFPLVMFKDHGARLSSKGEFFGARNEFLVFECLPYDEFSREEAPPFSLSDPGTELFSYTMSGPSTTPTFTMIISGVAQDDVYLYDGGLGYLPFTDIGGNYIEYDDPIDAEEVTVYASIESGFTSTDILYINMQSAKVSGHFDISGLTGISGRIHLAFNDITSISLPQVTSPFYQLRLNGNNITTLDMTPLNGRFVSNSFNEINLSGNGMATITLPTSSFGFYSLRLDGNSFSTIDFSPMPNLTDLDNCFINIIDNNMSDSEVDTILVDLDNLSSSGYTDREIRIGGNNSAPTATGLAAKASLESKGFTVLVTV